MSDKLPNSNQEPKDNGQTTPNDQEYKKRAALIKNTLKIFDKLIPYGSIIGATFSFFVILDYLSDIQQQGLLSLVLQPSILMAIFTIAVLLVVFISLCFLPAHIAAIFTKRSLSTQQAKPNQSAKDYKSQRQKTLCDFMIYNTTACLFALQLLALIEFSNYWKYIPTGIIIFIAAIYTLYCDQSDNSKLKRLVLENLFGATINAFCLFLLLALVILWSGGADKGKMPVLITFILFISNTAFATQHFFFENPEDAIKTGAAALILLIAATVFAILHCHNISHHLMRTVGFIEKPQDAQWYAIHDDYFKNNISTSKQTTKQNFACPSSVNDITSYCHLKTDEKTHKETITNKDGTITVNEKTVIS